MEILLPLDQPSFEGKGDDELKEMFEKTYTCHGIVPQVEICRPNALIRIEPSVHAKADRLMDQALAAIRNSRYSQARSIYEQIVSDCPFYSEAYRQLAQLDMLSGKTDAASDWLIDALRYDPANIWALILMGNVMTAGGNNESAEKYFRKALEYHPQNPVAICNVAGILAKQGKTDEAEPLFRKVLEIDSTYLNAYYGLGLICQGRNDSRACFEILSKGAVEGVERQENPGVRKRLVQSLLTAAEEFTHTFRGGVSPCAARSYEYA